MSQMIHNSSNFKSLFQCGSRVFRTFSALLKKSNFCHFWKNWIFDCQCSYFYLYNACIFTRITLVFLQKCARTLPAFLQKCARTLPVFLQICARIRNSSHCKSSENELSNVWSCAESVHVNVKRDRFLIRQGVDSNLIISHQSQEGEGQAVISCKDFTHEGPTVICPV